MNIQIVGYGTVGQALHSLINSDSVSVDIVDLKRKTTMDFFDYPDIVFICIPIPSENGNKNIAEVKKIVKKIKNSCEDDEVVVIKSSILYENYVELEKIYHKIIVNPEFLNENTSFEDVKFQKVILGGDYDNVRIVERFYKEKTYSNDVLVCTAKQACDFKYVHNLYSIWKLMFWEMVQDLTHDERKMYQLYKKFPTPDMSTIGLDGYRGIGGKCFPDNLECTKNKHKLLKAIYDYDKELKNESN